MDTNTFQHVFYKLMNKAMRCAFPEIDTLDYHGYPDAFQFGADHRCELSGVQAQVRGELREKTRGETFQVHLQEALCQVNPGPGSAQTASSGDRHQQRGAQVHTQRRHHARTKPASLRAPV